MKTCRSNCNTPKFQVIVYKDLLRGKLVLVAIAIVIVFLTLGAGRPTPTQMTEMHLPGALAFLFPGTALADQQPFAQDSSDIFGQDQQRGAVQGTPTPPPTSLLCILRCGL